MSNDKIAFIGGGNMTLAIASGLLDNNFAAADLAVADPNPIQRDKLRAALPGVSVVDDNADAVAGADAVVLAVKPQILAAVCQSLRPAVLKSRPLIVSIAAGPRIDDIDAWLGSDNAVVRVMPNQPALLRAGVSGVFANLNTSSAQRELAKRILNAIGPVVEVERESDIDTVTAMSGSGPAYFYLLIDIIARFGMAQNLSAADARRLAVETAAGAAAMAQASEASMDELISRVRSPGGTTAAALDSLDADDVHAIFERALGAAQKRAEALADQAHIAGETQGDNDNS